MSKPCFAGADLVYCGSVKELAQGYAGHDIDFELCKYVSMTCYQEKQLFYIANINRLN